MTMVPLPTDPAPGTRVLVTGAAGGIGRAITAHLAAAGCRLALCDIAQAEELDPAVDGQVDAYLRLDLSEASGVEAGVKELVAAMGGCDAVVGAAGVVDTIHRAQRFPLDAWDQDLAVNLTGQFALVRAAHDALRRSNGGRVVLVSSTAAETGLPGQAAYAASKAGLGGLVRTLAVEWAVDGIRCNLVMPGMIDTPKVQRLPEDVRSRTQEAIPLSRFGLPAHVAGAIGYLLSPAAAYVTGTVLRVDGGWGPNSQSLAHSPREAAGA